MVDPPQALSALTARDSRKAGWERKLTAPQNGWPATVQAALSKPREADHLEGRAQTYGQCLVELWQRAYGKALADSQRALAGMVDRTQCYERALVNERVPTRMGDGSLDVEVRPGLFSPFTGESIDALSIRANWLRQAEPGATASVIGNDDNGRAVITVGPARFTYGIEGLHRA